MCDKMIQRKLYVGESHMGIYQERIQLVKGVLNVHALQPVASAAATEITPTHEIIEREINGEKLWI